MDFKDWIRQLIKACCTRGGSKTAAVFLATSINFVYTYIMKAKIQKWGNSLGFRIPMTIARSLSLENGSIVEIEEVNDTIVVYSASKQNAEKLIDLITPENRHDETEWGKAEGKEIW